MFEAPPTTTAGAKRAASGDAPRSAVRRHGERAGPAPGGEGLPGQPAPGHVRGRRRAAKCPAATRSRGSRRAPAAPGRVPSARRTGGAVASSSARSRATTTRKLPRKVRSLARKSALNARAREGRLHVVENVTFEAPKTKQMAELLGNLGLEGVKVLVLTERRQPERVAVEPEPPDRARHAVRRGVGLRRDLERRAGGREVPSRASSPRSRRSRSRRRRARSARPRRP